MLYWDDNLNLANILVALYQVWGTKAAVQDIRIANAPTGGIMTIDVRIGAQEQQYLRLDYDQAHLAVYVKCEEGYVYLGKLTDHNVKAGFAACEMENLLQNFKAADAVLKGYRKKLI